MTSQSEQQKVTIHIFSNIKRGKGNQTMQFGQLIANNMRNIFLEKSYTKCIGKNSSRLFYKKSKLRISLDQPSEMLYCLFLLYVQAEFYQNITKLRC